MAVEPTRIRLVEWGDPVVISDADWERSQLSELYDRLVDASVLSVKRADGFRLVEPRNFVGRMRLPGKAVSVAPRFPELFQSVSQLVAGSKDKVLSQEDLQRLSDKRHALDPVQAFASAFEGACEVGLPFDYRPEVTTTSKPHGRLLFRETIAQIQSRGVFHLVRQESSRRFLDQAICSLALTTSSVLRSAQEIPPHLMSRLDRYEEIVADSGRLLTVPEALLVAGEMDPDSTLPAVARLIKVCESVLLGERVVWDFEVPMTGGECRFANTDRLWELATLTVFRSTIGDRRGLAFQYHPLGSRLETLFDDGGPLMDPDVVGYAGDSPEIVIDAKYSPSSRESAADVYQILAYGQRLGCKLAVLAYVSDSDEPWISHIGTWREILKLVAFGVAQKDAIASFGNLAETVLAELEPD